MRRGRPTAFRCSLAQIAHLIFQPSPTPSTSGTGSIELAPTILCLGLFQRVKAASLNGLHMIIPDGRRSKS